MRRNYILFNFPWVWLNLQSQKPSLEVQGAGKKTIEPPNWASEAAHLQTFATRNWELLGDGPNTRIPNQKGRSCVPCREGLHCRSYRAMWFLGSSPAINPRRHCCRQTLAADLLQLFTGFLLSLSAWVKRGVKSTVEPTGKKAVVINMDSRVILYFMNFSSLSP